MKYPALHKTSLDIVLTPAGFLLIPNLDKMKKQEYNLIICFLYYPGLVIRYGFINILSGYCANPAGFLQIPNLDKTKNIGLSVSQSIIHPFVIHSGQKDVEMNSLLPLGSFSSRQVCGLSYKPDSGVIH